MSSWRLVLILVSVATAVSLSLRSAGAQPNCEETPEGRVCRVQQPITVGQVLSVDLQRELGLVTVNGGCSGTLLNRWWVLTARHCVQTNPLANAFSALVPPGSVPVTAAWAAGRSGVPSRFVELGGAARRDIILLYLGSADLGRVNAQRLYRRVQGSQWVGVRLQQTDTVTQYGRGFATFATGGMGGTPVVLGTGAGVYRSGQFTPSNISETAYDLAMNATSQVGHGGDSGGPTIVTRDGIGVGIAGVQSTCTASGWAPGAPATNPPWPWATGITRCSYVSVEPVVREISLAISETGNCRPQPGCLMTPIIDYVMKP